MKVFNVIKRAIKWYFNLAAKTYAWTPSCTIPYIRLL